MYPTSGVASRDAEWAETAGRGAVGGGHWVTAGGGVGSRGVTRSAEIKSYASSGKRRRVRIIYVLCRPDSKQ